jgi:hypothetical protein
MTLPAPDPPDLETRREFMWQLSASLALRACEAGSTTALAAAGAIVSSDDQPPGAPASKLPWFRRTYRWGQTNLTEIDPKRIDIDWWRGYWKETEVQGVIINAGGIYAYYPSRFPLHRRAAELGDRDLYGELARAAHADGLAVLARMDSSRAHDHLYQAHPDWFARDIEGKPYRAGELYITCVNSPYYEDYLPSILREIIERSHPEGVTDNSWSGLDRARICYCDHCQKRFSQSAGKPLPRGHDWNDPVYRAWITWSYECRLALWDRNNRVTREAGGPSCLWIGMNGGSVSGQCRSLRDTAAICGRSEIVMLDHQARGNADSFQNNAETGKLLHGLLGWDKLIPESMPMYQMGRPTFRLSAKPEAEARMWMLAGFAGGIQPWWHHVAAFHEDRRMYRTAAPVFRWHKAHEEFLVNRRPVATVGVVWSQRNIDFFGRDDPEGRVDRPWRGYTEALVRARIPYVPVCVDHIDHEAPRLAVLILPNLAALSDAQAAAILRFGARGGAVIATGLTSLYDEWGDPRADFALSDLLGVRRITPPTGDLLGTHAALTRHTYLRLVPERNDASSVPKAHAPHAGRGIRHPALTGFDETDLLPYGGTLAPLAVDPRCQVLMTFVPEFPIFPPESAWMREPRTTTAGLVIHDSRGGLAVYLAADLDRRFAIDHLPDHADLLANLVRYAARGKLPLEVHGRGLIDCELYEQPGRLILHLVNLTSAEAWRPPVHELIPIGPLHIRIGLAGSFQPRKLRTLVSNRELPFQSVGNAAAFVIESVVDHEVVIVEA